MPMLLLPAFILGVVLLQQQPQLWPSGTLLALLPLCLLARSLPQRLRLGAYLLLALALGFGWANLRAQLRLADSLPTIWEGRDISVIAVVAELPQAIERGQRLRLDVEQTLTPGVVVPHRVQVNDYAGNRAYQPGQRWRFELRLKRPHASLNPHTFDAESWMLQQNIRATGQIRSAQLQQALVWRPAYLIDRCRSLLRQHMLATLGQRPYAGLVVALSIGDQGAIPAAQWQVFARTGLTHLVSISGLHVTLVASLVALLAGRLWRHDPQRLLRLPQRKLMLLAGGVTALIYSLLAGFSIPTQRTLYMLTIAGFALWSGKTLSIWRVLLLAAAVVVMIDPWAVLAPGFWLSFGAVACLIWASQYRLQTPHWLRQWGRLQWMLLLGMAPALLLLFQQLPLASPLANGLAIPLIGTLATPLCLLGIVIPPLLLLAHRLIEWCLWPINWLASWPQIVWEQATPTLWTVWLAAPGIIWLTLPRGWPQRWLGLLLLLPMLFTPHSPPAPGQLRLSMLDVGQGTALVLQTSRHALLYDTGPAFTREADSGNRIILPWLRGDGITRLDGLILSHDDSDHTGGAHSLLQQTTPGWLLHSLPTAHPLLTPLRSPVLRCQAGQSWQWDGVSFRVLWPDASSVANSAIKDNDRSCVIRVDAACGSVLLTGDLERPAEQQLLDQAVPLRADVLLVPHHGSKTSSSADFIAAVAPRLALVSAGYRNRFGHPRSDVLQRYLQQQVQIVRTDYDGATELWCQHQSWYWQTQRQQAPRYWHQESLTTASTVLPLP